METGLVILGVALLVAAIVGGGIEFHQIKIPVIASGGQRIAIGAVGVAVFICGLYAGRLTGGPRDDLVSPKPTPPDSISTDLPVPTRTLNGAVDLSYHTVAFSERHTDYSVTASTVPTQEFSASLDAQGQFSFGGVPEQRAYTVSWSVSRPSEFVIWPLDHTGVYPGKQFSGFRLQRLDDVFGNEKVKMREAIRQGAFATANERLSTILQLFGRLRVRDSPADPVARKIFRWRFTLHRDLANAAHEFRTTAGRSGITDQHVQFERQWRRTMINRALQQSEAGQRLRDLARATNSWASYAREVFSKAQRNWPDRSLASRQTQSDRDFLHNNKYEAWLLEDIALIKEKLATPEVEKLVEQSADREDQMARLAEGQRAALESFNLLLGQDPDRVSLNQFVNLLGALHLLIVPTDSPGDWANPTVPPSVP